MSSRSPLPPVGAAEAGKAQSPERELEAILETGSIRVEFQPIVDLFTGSAVAHEALCRGPRSSALEAPEDLLEAARRCGRLDELDWACRVAALAQALEAGIRPPQTLFLNIEPTVTSAPPEATGPALARAMEALRVVVELTERDLLAHPAQLLSSVEAFRYTGWGIAVDDIGAHPHSIAMLSVIEPDVVKLDHGLLASMSSSRAAALVSGVQGYCARSGARIVIERLETPGEVLTAKAVKAHYGQGWQFGRPQPVVPSQQRLPAPVPLINPRPHRPTRKLITLVTRRESPQRVTRDVVDRLTDYVLEHASSMGDDVLVVVDVQNEKAITASLVRRLDALSRRVAHVEVMGSGLGPQITPSIRGTRLPVNDPLVCEWVVAVIGLHESIALVAADLGDDHSDDTARRYDLAVTYEPQLVTDVARALLARVH